MSRQTALRLALLALGAVGGLVPWPGAAAPAIPSAGARTVTATTPPVAPPRAPGAFDRGRVWDWPLDPRPAVTSAFVPPRSTYGAGHRGLDLAAAQGQGVLAVDAGVVSHVGVIAGRGTVSVTHSSGLRSTYEPVAASVGSGTVVAQGDVLGRVAGRTHCGGACLHLGALVGPAYVDPRQLLGAGPVILLPLGPGR
ncbi:M23 family metallopeptidase [Knoellia aerolata]|nr:M23 family metallopeptidase [Knoellia aerolata]